MALKSWYCLAELTYSSYDGGEMRGNWVCIAGSLMALALLAGCGSSLVPSSTEQATPTLVASPLLPSTTPLVVPTGTPLVAPTVEPRVADTPIASSLASTVSLRRGPYLQSVTENSVLIVWETDEAAHSVVEYGLTQEYGEVVSAAIPATKHVVSLTGLAPYTTYHYRVGTSEGALIGDNTFRTAADPRQTTFSFAVLGETRTNDDNHRLVVESIIAARPDFYLHLGDMVGDGSSLEEWEIFFQIEAELLSHVPIFSSLGNHERNHHNYYEVFYLPNNERWYSFDYGHAHFVCLQIDGFSSYGQGTEQYFWLEEDLASTEQPWKFVFFHVPPYSSGPHGGDLQVRAALHPLFVRHGVDIVFNGHDHDYERSVADGVTYVVTGGGGAALYGKWNVNEASIYFESTLHFVSISLAGDTLTSKGVRPDGTEFDPFVLNAYR